MNHWVCGINNHLISIEGTQLWKICENTHPHWTQIFHGLSAVISRPVLITSVTWLGDQVGRLICAKLFFPKLKLEISGYLLARPTLRLLVEQGLDQNTTVSQLLGEQDDLTIGNTILICLLTLALMITPGTGNYLERLGAIFADTRDSSGRQRFLHCHPLELFEGSLCRNLTKEVDFYREKVISIYKKLKF